jgi:hypothetical protein
VKETVEAPSFDMDMEATLAELGSRIGADKPAPMDDFIARESEPEPAETFDEDSFDRIAELMMQSTPEPIPDMFASPPPPPPPKRRPGLWILLSLVVLVILAALAAGLYYLQEQVINAWPPAERIYQQLHVRNEVIGYGLVFRDGGSERQMENGTEVLVVRGVIANTTSRVRKIPLIRLMLTNGKMVLQQKVIEPPQAALAAQENVGFRITLEQPDPHATGFGLTFTKSNPLIMAEPMPQPAPDAVKSPTAAMPAAPSPAKP